MAGLDQWTESYVVNPLIYAHAEDGEKGWRRCTEEIKRAIRDKVLESYRNGQAAGPSPARKAAR